MLPYPSLAQNHRQSWEKSIQSFLSHPSKDLPPVFGGHALNDAKFLYIFRQQFFYHCVVNSQSDPQSLVLNRWAAAQTLVGHVFNFYNLGQWLPNVGKNKGSQKPVFAINLA